MSIQELQLPQGDLSLLLNRMIPESNRLSLLDDLFALRVSAPTEMGHGTSFPSLCVIAQGSKEIRLGNRIYRYDPEHYLVANATLPIATRVVEASPEHPYLGIVMALDPTLIGSVMAEIGTPGGRHRPTTAIDVSDLGNELRDAILRLAKLHETPDAAPVLAPLIRREIVYLLLTGAQGDRVRDIANMGGETNRMARVVERLRQDFNRPLRISNLAEEVGMSLSSFHHHFKAVTAMSPLQFQKQLRLQEARRLILSEDFDATTAGMRVGYEDVSQFNREYKRMFGAPPMRDVARLRSAPITPSSL